MTFMRSRTWALAGALLASSCGLAAATMSQAAPAAAIGQNQFTVDGIQNIQIGMRRAQVSAHIRPVGNMRAQGFSAAESQACDTYDTRDGRASVMIENGVVTSIVTDNRAFRTPSGAFVGMPLRDLRRIYGRQLNTKQNPYDGFDLFVRAPSGNGLKFHVSGGRVGSMTAGRGGSLEYVEGCL